MTKTEFDRKYGHALDRAYTLFKEGRRIEIELENTLDMMRDEFQRIFSLPDATEEIKGLCERAMANIEQHVPVIQQRDDALKELREVRRRIKVIEENIRPVNEDHPEFENFIRAFWRRIEPYKTSFDKELPKELPVQFRVSMATALLHLYR